MNIKIMKTNVNNAVTYFNFARNAINQNALYNLKLLI